MATARLSALELSETLLQAAEDKSSSPVTRWKNNGVSGMRELRRLVPWPDRIALVVPGLLWSINNEPVNVGRIYSLLINKTALNSGRVNHRHVLLNLVSPKNAWLSVGDAVTARR